MAWYALKCPDCAWWETWTSATAATVAWSVHYAAEHTHEEGELEVPC